MKESGCKKMPVISFSTLKSELISRKKRQTIRPKITDHWLRFKKGDYLYAYWKLRVAKEKEFLFTERLIEDIFIVRWDGFTDALMLRDGFDSLEQGNRVWFIPNYGVNGKTVLDKEFVVLRW